MKIIDKILQEDYGLHLHECGAESPNTFVYVDDCIYTGNRLRYDLTAGGGTTSPAWISRDAPFGCNLKILMVASHTARAKAM